MNTPMIEKLIKNAMAGRFGENFISIAVEAKKELEVLSPEPKQKTTEVESSSSSWYCDYWNRKKLEE